MNFHLRLMALAALASGPLPSRADPAAEAAAHHRDLQQDGEGVVVAAVSPDGIRYGAAGRLAADGPEVDESTLFEIGSITKVFTGILLADLVLRDLAALDDPVAVHLPGGLISGESPLREITLLELATHSSGLPRLASDLEKGSDPADPYAHYDEERLHAYLGHIGPDDLAERGKTSYSNLGFGLLGHLLKRISGKPYETLLAETVFDPLGMADSFVLRRPDVLPEELAPRLATGHAAGRPVPHWHGSVHSSAGAVVSSARDLARFAAAHFSPETPAGLRAAMDLAATPHRGGVGLGWFVNEDSVGHDGRTGGFSSSLAIQLSEKTASIRLANGTAPAPEPVGKGDFTGLSGYWEGVLGVGNATLRLVFRISESGRVVLHSLDQGGSGLPAERAAYEDGMLRAFFAGIGGRFEGQVGDGAIEGTWRQGEESPLRLVRSEGVPAALETALARRAEGKAPELDGWWSGYLGGKEGLFVVLEVERVGDTAEARLYSPDQSPEPMPVTKLSFRDGQLVLEVGSIGASYAAKLGEDGTFVGAWKQGPAPTPLSLRRSAERPQRE